MPKVVGESTPVAENDRQCHGCCGDIRAGDLYHKTRQVVDHTRVETDLCRKCSFVWSTLADDDVLKVGDLKKSHHLVPEDYKMMRIRPMNLDKLTAFHELCEYITEDGDKCDELAEYIITDIITGKANLICQGRHAIFEDDHRYTIIPVPMFTSTRSLSKQPSKGSPRKISSLRNSVGGIWAKGSEGEFFLGIGVFKNPNTLIKWTKIPESLYLELTKYQDEQDKIKKV